VRAELCKNLQVKDATFFSIRTKEYKQVITGRLKFKQVPNISAGGYLSAYEKNSYCVLI